MSKAGRLAARGSGRPNEGQNYLLQRPARLLVLPCNAMQRHGQPESLAVRRRHVRNKCSRLCGLSGPQPRPPAPGTSVLQCPQENPDSLFITFANMFVRSYHDFQQDTPDSDAGDGLLRRLRRVGSAERNRRCDGGGEHRTSASGKPGALVTIELPFNKL